MGIHDRQYYSDEHEPRGFQFGGGPSRPRMLVTNLVIINVVIYVVDFLWKTNISLPGGEFATIHPLNEYFSLHADLFVRPWNFWQLLTHGFLHNLGSIQHVAFNMLGLWMLGREVEIRYGRRTFLQFYLSTIILAGLGSVVWSVIEFQTLSPPVIGIGASGGVFGVVAVFVLLNPHSTVYLMGVVPIPRWGIGVVFLVVTVFAQADPTDNTSHSAHIAGIACGLIFFYKGWQLGKYIPERFSLAALKPRPNIRIHDPDAKQREKENKMKSEVDRILDKITREGEDSLTGRERRKLQEASRKFQKGDS